MKKKHKKIFREPNLMVDYIIRKNKEDGKLYKEVVNTDLMKERRRFITSTNLNSLTK